MRRECETVIGYHETDLGAGVAVLRSKDPRAEGVAQETPRRCERCSLSARHPHPDRARGRPFQYPTRPDQFPPCPCGRGRLRHGGFPPHHAELALATFTAQGPRPTLLRPPASRPCQPAGYPEGWRLPARKDQRIVVRVNRRLQIHCFQRRRSLEREAIGDRPEAARPANSCGCVSLG